MTQEDKELLLTDLYARLPYGVKILDEQYGQDELLTTLSVVFYPIENIKPYLRPMSSMTDEEDTRRCAFLDDIEGGIEDAIPNYIDWLNAHHFDYHGLIEKGLAMEAPEGMYNF